MKKSILFTLLILLPLNLSANIAHDNYYVDGKKYKLVKKEADKFLSGYLSFSKSLLNCKKHVFEYYNPLIHKNGKYEIFGAKRDGTCLIYLNYNNMREFKCDLQAEDISKIVTGRIDLIREKSGFGAFSDGEQEVYFNKQICKRNHFKKKNKEISIDELKKNIDNPELIEFLETYQGKKGKK
jgi:hypothetical protein